MRKHFGLLALTILFWFGGCASTPPDDRFLTKEEDQAMREQCEATGCVVLPAPVFQDLMNLLNRGSL